MKPYTEVGNRKIRFDGVSIMHPDYIPEFMCAGLPPNKILTTIINDEVELFNSQVDDVDKIKLFNVDGDLEFNFMWNLPDSYNNIDLLKLASEKLEQIAVESKYSEAQMAMAVDRIAAEMEEIKSRDLQQLFNTIVYVLDTFQAKGVVWGVGRGSSCASYILFLLGLHVVDCVLFDVPMEEFFHD